MSEQADSEPGRVPVAGTPADSDRGSAADSPTSGSPGPTPDATPARTPARTPVPTTADRDGVKTADPEGPTGADEREDGRLAQGRRRRETLIAATLRLIERDGIAGVTHRRVAREADVSPTSASYHFHTIDELLVATLTVACEQCVRDLERAVAAAGDDFEGLARSIADPAAERRTAQIAAFELWLLAARRPELLAAARVWTTAVTAFARRHSDDPQVIEAFVALVDGFHLQVLTREHPPARAEIEAALRRGLGVAAG